MSLTNTLSMPRHAQRLLLAASAGAALLLLAACGGSDAEVPADDDQSLTATTANGATTNTASTSEDSTKPDDGSTTVELTPLTADEYVLEASELIKAVTATSALVATQLENADVDSKAWRTETATVLRELAAVLDGTSKLTAPDEYATRHQALIEATSKYSWATEMLADGVETLDLDTISNAAALLANASAEFANAQAGITS